MILDHDDYNLEPRKGLPEHLPPGEHLLWQGAPSAPLMARRVFYTRLLGIYFTLLILGHGVFSLRDGVPIAEVTASGFWMLTMAAIALAILMGLAIGYARTTLYTITTERLVLRFGLAIPLVINIPLRHIYAADMRRHEDGSGDIVLRVARHKAVSYVALWPNVRPASFLRADPALRCLADVDGAAQALASIAPANASRSSTRDAVSEAQSADLSTGAAVPS